MSAPPFRGFPAAFDFESYGPSVPSTGLARLHLNFAHHHNIAARWR